MNISLNLLKYNIIFIYGICIGSFLNVVIYRVPKGISVLNGRSKCPKCGTVIKIYDLFPIFSFFILKRKCRVCNKEISLRYPAIEFFSGFIAVITFYINGFLLESVIIFLIASILICISIIDKDTFTIPTELVLSMIPLVLLLVYFRPETQLYERIIGFFVISIPMILSRYFIPNSFGGGDVRLIAIGGFMLGWKSTLVATSIAIMSAGVYASYLLISKKSTKKDYISFGPYLSLGIYIALMKGTDIINSYLDFIV